MPSFLNEEGEASHYWGFYCEQMSVRFSDVDTEEGTEGISSEGKKMVGSVTIPAPSLGKE